VTYADKIEPAERLLDPALDAASLERRVRALTPHVGVHVALPSGERLGVRRAAVRAGERVAPGQLAAGDGRLLLGTAAGTLELLEVQPAGRKPMDAAAYLRGRGAGLASRAE
jgi:methionyl-tRNA formyltransferase